MTPVSLAAERRALADQVVVAHPRVRQAHTVFDFLRAHAAARPNGEMRCVPLIAPSQSGKTTIIRSYKERANAKASDARQVPVLHVVLQANSTRKQLAHDILHELSLHGFETAKTKGTEADLLDRVERNLSHGRVELLVIDEFQHIIHSDSAKTAASVGDTIKRMLITGICPIVLSGTEKSHRPFKENHQLAYRSEPPIELRPLQVDNHDDLTLFIDFLADYALALEEAGALSSASILVCSDVPACLLEASQGVLGVTCNLIKDAIKTLTLSLRSEITRDDLAEAVQKNLVAQNIYSRNPFREGYAPLRAPNIRDG